MILGKKVGMTRVFDEGGKQIAVTVVRAGPCVVVQRKTEETDGYEAVQVGFEEHKRSRMTNPLLGHFESRGVEPMRHLREFRVSGGDGPEPGEELTVEQFEKGQIVDVVGTSKGKGFAGAMKRYGFKGGPASHGSKVHRSPMSGGATDAARTFKGARRPGHMGNARVTVKGLEIIDVDPGRNLLVLRGAVPGGSHGLLTIRGRE